MAADGPTTSNHSNSQLIPDAGRNPAVANKQDGVCDNNQDCACDDVIERKHTHTHLLPFKESPPSHNGEKQESGNTKVMAWTIKA